MKFILAGLFILGTFFLRVQTTTSHWIRAVSGRAYAQNIQLRAFIGREGHLFGRQLGFQIPYVYGSSSSIAPKAAGIWLGGQINNTTAVSIQRSNSFIDGFGAGLLDDQTGLPVANAEKFNQIFTIERHEIDALRTDIAANGHVTDSALFWDNLSVRLVQLQNA